MANSESDSSDLDDLNWSYKNRKQAVLPCKTNKKDPVLAKNDNCELPIQVHEKFGELKKKSETIKLHSDRRMQILEKRRSKKLIKKALKDPEVRELVKKNQNASESEQSTEVKEKKEWDEIKPFLTVKSPFQGVHHDNFGPKTEIQSIIQDAIKEGDFEKAELLSDTLANKEFAGKICKAFAAKRCHEQLEEQKALNKVEQMKKIRWTFEAKQKWEMKGNM